MSFSEALFSISFDDNGKIMDNALPIGRTVVLSKERTRYMGWVQIQDYFGAPHRIAYVRVNIIEGRDGSSACRLDTIRQQARISLATRYKELVKASGGIDKIPIEFVPKEVKNGTSETTDKG